MSFLQLTTLFKLLNMYFIFEGISLSNCLFCLFTDKFYGLDHDGFINHVEDICLNGGEDNIDVAE